MRMYEILNESIDFQPTVYDPELGYDTSRPFEGDYEPCNICHGTGKTDDIYYSDNGTCSECEGVGHFGVRKLNAPSLNVANANAFVILDMLGIEHGNEALGLIKNDQLPEIKRRLIKLKNSSVDMHARGPKKTGGETFVDKTGNLPQIKRKATMIDPGRSTGQIKRYVDRLLDIVDFAQKNKANITFS